MKSTRKQQKSFVLILALIVCLAVFVIGCLLPAGLRFTNSTYAQADADNINDIRNILSEDSTSDDSTHFELYNEDGTIQRIQEPDNLQSDDYNTINPLAASTFNERKLLDSGKPDSESIVITIMGDGFTATQQSDFINLATDVINKMVGNPQKGINGCYPFNIFRDYFTVYAIEVISNQSGVSRDADTNNGVIVDNYFGSSFYYGRNDSNIDRALVITRLWSSVCLKKT